MNRRSFAESLAAAALAPMLGVPVDAVRLAHPRGAEPGSETASATAMALALVEIIRLEYGHRLGPADLADVGAQVQAGLDRADLIRRADQRLGV